jgi:SAM-dependent methyltransferase
LSLADLRRYLHAAYIDLRLFLSGKSEKGLPPLRLRDVGQGDFRAIGESLAAMLVRHGLRASHRVLDIGSGVGRVAIPLTKVLTGGSYDGLDIVPSWVRWCRRNITPSHPRFRFTLANVFNSHYNRRGVPPASFRFPYDDAAFDFAFATSLFTHLGVDDARHYLREVHRVLRPGGRLVATFFLLGSEKTRALEFRVNRGSHRLLDEADPDWGIAFDESFLDELFPPSQWRDRLVETGGWRGGTGDQWQDVVRAVRL